MLLNFSLFSQKREKVTQIGVVVAFQHLKKEDSSTSNRFEIDTVKLNNRIKELNTSLAPINVKLVVQKVIQAGYFLASNKNDYDKFYLKKAIQAKFEKLRKSNNGDILVIVVDGDLHGFVKNQAPTPVHGYHVSFDNQKFDYIVMQKNSLSKYSISPKPGSVEFNPFTLHHEIGHFLGASHECDDILEKSPVLYKIKKGESYEIHSSLMYSNLGFIKGGKSYPVIYQNFFSFANSTNSYFKLGCWNGKNIVPNNLKYIKKKSNTIANSY